MPVLIGRDKPLRNPEVAEKAVTNAIKAFLKQSEALANCDYNCQVTVGQLRRILKKDKDDFAMQLGISRETLDAWENGQDPTQIARTMSYTVRSVDEMFRLISFAGGGPDSRPEFSLGDLLKYLTADQFDIFTKWVDEGKLRAANKKGQDGIVPMQ